MTRDEIEQDVRKIDRRCRGPFSDKITDAHIAKMSEELKDVANPTISALVLKSLLLEKEETKPLARELDDVMRPGCGEDFNKVILAGPFDGSVHEYQCAWCGVKGFYRAPFYEVTA